MMTVKLNDKQIALPDGSSLHDALVSANVPLTGIAAAVNGTVVPASQRDSHKLSDGDSILIIKAFYGG